MKQEVVTPGFAKKVENEIGTLNSKIENVDETTVISDLLNIPVNSQGRIRLAASVSPTGAESVFDYHCFGYNNRITLKASHTYKKGEWINYYNENAWGGWDNKIENVNETTAISNLLNIPVNSQGRIRLAAAVSPTGAESVFDYHCFGYNNHITLKVSHTYRKDEWINYYNENAWSGWDSFALNSKLNNLVGGYNGTGTSVTFNCTNDFKSRQYAALLIGKDDVYLISLHNVNYGGISLKTGTQLQASTSENSVTISGLPNTRYYVINVSDSVISSITFS